MTITTKYDIGQQMTWKIGGKPLIITGVKVLSETYMEYVCSYSDHDGNPKELAFTEQEIEPWKAGDMGFKGAK
jgi:uncharacterized protein YodC (DUF2158 family)